MFSVSIPPFEYSDPWGQPYDERLKKLKGGSRHVAYLYEATDNSTFRYRAFNMIQLLAEFDKDMGAAYFTYSEIDLLDKVIEVADVLVVCRFRYSHKLNRLISEAKARGVRVLFDVEIFFHQRG